MSRIARLTEKVQGSRLPEERRKNVSNMGISLDEITPGVIVYLQGVDAVDHQVILGRLPPEYDKGRPWVCLGQNVWIPLTTTGYEHAIQLFGIDYTVGGPHRLDGAWASIATQVRMPEASVMTAAEDVDYLVERPMLCEAVLEVLKDKATSLRGCADGR